MAIVTVTDVRNFLNASDETWENDNLAFIHNSVEEYVKNFCNRDFDSTKYFQKVYDGTGYSILALNHFPIVSVDRVSISKVDVMKITNTNSSSTASVSVTATGLRLVLDGTADSTVLFATYTTMTTVVDAVNALGNGWSAALSSSTYAAFKSTELLKKFGQNAIDTNWVDLVMPDGACDDFDVDEDKGWLIRYGSWPKGRRNVIVDYTAGFSDSNMPKDLQMAVKILVQYFNIRKNEEGYGVSEFRMADIWGIFEEKNMPKEVIDILSRYKRVKI